MRHMCCCGLFVFWVVFFFRGVVCLFVCLLLFYRVALFWCAVVGFTDFYQVCCLRFNSACTRCAVLGFTVLAPGVLS